MNQYDETLDETSETPMPLTSLDVTDERLSALRALFPEAFAEGALDAQRLKELVGQGGRSSPERYGLSWAGKAEALRAVQGLSTGTLRPQRAQSVDFDTTQNLIIEGDNLEVLKLLQKSYHRRVKMIYIDRVRLIHKRIRIQIQIRFIARTGIGLISSQVFTVFA